MNPNDPAESNLSNLSPYPLRETGNGYAFTTNQGVTYELAFRDDADYFSAYPYCGPIYSFAIALNSRQAGAKDSRVETTVLYALQLLFEYNPSAILTYTCSTENNQGRQRNTLFRRWFERNKAGFTRIEQSNQAIEEYSVAIFRADHPNHERVKVMFAEVFKEK